MASSRFWAGSDDDSSEEGSADSSEGEQEKVKTANRWATVSDSESSDEGERVVKSARWRRRRGSLVRFVCGSGGGRAWCVAVGARDVARGGRAVARARLARGAFFVERSSGGGAPR